MLKEQFNSFEQGHDLLEKKSLLLF